MARKLGFLSLLMVLAIPAWAGITPGTISGYVKNARGVPQLGATVQISTARRPLPVTVFTDEKGFYTAADLDPGVYNVKVSAPSFLPSLREKVQLNSGAAVIVNLTLSTLFEALQLVPETQPGAADDDDWKWTLRSTANRSILRALPNRTVAVVTEGEDGLEGIVAFFAGAERQGFGSSGDMTTAVSLEQSLFTGRFSFNGNFDHNAAGPGGVFRATNAKDTTNGSRPELALTVRHLASPGDAARNAALDAIELSVANRTVLNDFLELSYGGSLQTVQFMSRVSTFKPFGAIRANLWPDTYFEYRYATTRPNTRHWKGHDTAPADLTESGPQMSLSGHAPVLEKARHQEIALNHKYGDYSVQIAAYYDQIRDAALLGVGEVSDPAGELLPDVYSGTFTYNGGELDTKGMRVVVQRKFGGVTATVDYAFGGVIRADEDETEFERAHRSLHTAKAHSVATRVGGTLPRAKTRWITTYKWSSDDSLTPVDLFNQSPGQADPYLSIFLRQPIPTGALVNGKLEAIIDLRNLLAQGYLPVLGKDGSTMYLVQAARSVRGGVAFVF
jgi:hypothetical protein